MSDTETVKATKREHVLVDVKVEADLSGMLWYRHYKSEEERARDLEQAVKDFDDFLRDHRSQDMISLDVVRVYKDLCSACGCEWETWTENGETTCAGCGAQIEALTAAEVKE